MHWMHLIHWSINVDAISMITLRCKLYIYEVTMATNAQNKQDTHVAIPSATSSQNIYVSIYGITGKYSNTA